jgi:lysophospholipase L1-like esterase
MLRWSLKYTGISASLCSVALACSGTNAPGMSAMNGANGVAGSSTTAMAGAGASGSTGTSVGSGGSHGSAGSTVTVGAAGKASAGSGGASGGGHAGMGAGGDTGSAGAAADMGGGGAAGMAMGSAGSDGGSGATHMDLGKGDGKDVITIGDSWMNLIIDGIEPALDMASGQTYRHYAIPGTIVLSEAAGQIPAQYESAKMENPNIKTIVMTGGGNDILGSSCADTACNSIVDMVSARLAMLMQETAKDGVQDIILIGYTYPDDMTKRESLDYSIMLSGRLCVPDGMPRCHFLDSSKLTIMLRDGIHPDAAGYQTVAKAAWKLMQDNGVRR